MILEVEQLKEEKEVSASFSASTGAVSVYVYECPNPHNGAFSYVQSPLGLCEEESGVNYEAWGKAYGFVGGAELIGIGTEVAIKGFPEVGPWSLVGAAPFWLSGGALWWASAGGPDLVTPVVNTVDDVIEHLPAVPDPAKALQDAINNDMMDHGYNPSDPVDQYDYWYDGFTGGGF